MAIKEYKLGDISFVKNGNKNKEDQVINGKYNFYTRSKQILRSNDYSIDGNYIIIPGEGIFDPMWNSGKAAIHQRVYYISANENICNTKYLYYWWIKNNDILYKNAVGTTVKSLRLRNFLDPKIKLPDLQVQQEIINIIEPFENKKIKLLEIRNFFQNLIKNIYSKSQSKKAAKINDVFKIKRNKKIDSNEVIELSSLNSCELFNSHFGNINDFKTNIFSIKKHDIYISTIRPKLKKFGIAWKDSNILGTICVLSGDIKNIASLLGLLLQEDFMKKCSLNSYGTKMPILDKKWLVQNEFKKLSECEIDLIKKIINYVSNLSEQILLLKKIINSLIQMLII